MFYHRACDKNKFSQNQNKNEKHAKNNVVHNKNDMKNIQE